MTNKRLIKERKKVVDGLPDAAELVRGSLVKRYLRCGKVECRCHRGKGHGPYYYLMTTLGPGKTRMVVISKEQLPEVGRWVKNFTEYKKRLEKIAEINTHLLQAERQSRTTSAAKGTRKKQ